MADRCPRNVTCCVRSERKDLIQLSADPVMPNVRSSRNNRISWSTQSNAALRSRRPRSVTSCLSMELRRSEMTRSNAVSVEWCFRYADCSTGIKLRKTLFQFRLWKPARERTQAAALRMGWPVRPPRSIVVSSRDPGSPEPAVLGFKHKQKRWRWN